MIVDLSGFMFSGKSVVSDILSEFKNVNVPDKRVEFDLLRVGGGLIDLKNAVEDWSPVRTDAAIRRFDKLIIKLNRSTNYSQSFFQVGWNYGEKYKNLLEFYEIFLNEIIELGWDTPWPYSDLDLSEVELLAIRLNEYKNNSNWFLLRQSANISLKILKALQLSVFNNRHYFKNGNKDRYTLMVTLNDFILASRKFIYNILEVDKLTNSGFDIIVTHNALEAFNPGRNLDLLGDNAKCIVVDRDPRDIFCTANSFSVGFNDQVDFYKKIAGANDVNVFIQKYNIYRSRIVTDERVLRLKFSDFFISYDESLLKITQFLNLKSSFQIKRKSVFCPEKSISNLNMWEKAEFIFLANEIKKIQNECF